MRAGRTLAEVESALDAEIEQLVTGRPVTEAELVKAVKRAKAAFAFSSESVTNQGFWLGLGELAAGSYHWFQDYVTSLQGVTVEDMAEAAARYFDRRRRTVGWYVPQGDGEPEADA